MGKLGGFRLGKKLEIRIDTPPNLTKLIGKYNSREHIRIK